MILQSQQCVEEATIEDENILQNGEDEQGGDGQGEDNMDEPGIGMIMLPSLFVFVKIILFFLSPFSPQSICAWENP